MNDTAPVVVEVNVEDMIGTTETVEIPRAKWDAMTPDQRAGEVADAAAEVMNGTGGYGWHIISGATDDDIDLTDPLQLLHQQLTEHHDSGASSNDLVQLVDDFFTARGYTSILYR